MVGISPRWSVQYELRMKEIALSNLENVNCGSRNLGDLTMSENRGSDMFLSNRNEGMVFNRTELELANDEDDDDDDDD
jgi:hypothetical protein